MKMMNTLVALADTVAVVLGLSGCATMGQEAEPTKMVVVEALQKGGNVLVIRHAETTDDMADTDPWHLDNVDAQRQLNESGRRQSEAMGRMLRELNVHIGETFTSRFRRAIETAELAHFEPAVALEELTEGGLVVTPAENERRADALRALLGKAPAAGLNTVLVTHKPNIADGLGASFYTVKPGEITVVRPEAGAEQGFVVVGRLTLAELRDLWHYVGAKRATMARQ